MNIFHASISSVASSSSSTATPSSSLSQTKSTTYTSSSASCTPVTTPGRVLSSFNPTKTYHIPSHGGLLPCTIPIYDLTPLLRDRKTANDPYNDRKLFKREVRSILKRLRGSRGKEKDKGVSETMELDGMVLRDWQVPWGLWKPISVRLREREEEVEVWTGDYDPRSQEFEWAGASYRWRFTSPRELVLEKQANGIGRYTVAVFCLTVSSAFFPAELRAWAEVVVKRGVGSTEGTLLFDSRGVDRTVVVATCLIALKRERQRWGVLGGTI
ncbi:hypothetical protein BDD12DRAFT_814968 [Trichophaea hybrida]|nr:hypothetical protein BDD12DRAFT_814968 [Trichophaea hybrida]